MQAEHELVQGKNSILRSGVLGLSELVCARMEWIRSKIRFLWWWLVLFIEAPVLFPNVLAGRDPTTANFEGGQLVQDILTKGGLHPPKALVVAPPWAPR